MNALALAGQTVTAMGKGPAKEKPGRSEWVVRGRTRNIFQRGKGGRQIRLVRNPFSTLRLSKQRIGESREGGWGAAGTVDSSLPNFFLLWVEFIKHFMCGKLLRYRGNLLTETAKAQGAKRAE